MKNNREGQGRRFSPQSSTKGIYQYETDSEVVTLDLDTEDIVEWQCYSHGFDRWVSIELTDTLRDSPHYQDMKDKALEARSAELEYEQGEAIYDYYKEAGDL